MTIDFNHLLLRRRTQVKTWLENSSIKTKADLRGWMASNSHEYHFTEAFVESCHRELEALRKISGASPAATVAMPPDPLVEPSEKPTEAPVEEPRASASEEEVGVGEDPTIKPQKKSKTKNI